jgi:hypothetical protein
LPGDVIRGAEQHDDGDQPGAQAREASVGRSQRRTSYPSPFSAGRPGDNRRARRDARRGRLHGRRFERGLRLRWRDRPLLVGLVLDARFGPPVDEHDVRNRPLPIMGSLGVVLWSAHPHPPVLAPYLGVSRYTSARMRRRRPLEALRRRMECACRPRRPDLLVAPATDRASISPKAGSSEHRAAATAEADISTGPGQHAGGHLGGHVVTELDQPILAPGLSPALPFDVFTARHRRVRINP